MSEVNEPFKAPRVPPPPRPDLVDGAKATLGPAAHSAHLLNEAKWNGTVLGGLVGVAMSLAIGAAHYIFVTDRMAAAGSGFITLQAALFLVPAGVYFGLRVALRLQRRKREDLR